MTADAFWKPFEVEINDFDGLVQVVNQVMDKAVEKNINFAWRGQVDASWALHSSLYRRMNITRGKILPEADIEKAEGEILVELHRWGLHSSNHGGRLSVLKQLAMLQHYGAPTRLIDITFNAWVGVWFAVEEKWSNGVLNEDVDARLFAFDITDRLINEKAEFRSWEDSYHRPWKSGAIDDLDRKEWTTSVYAWKPSSLDARIAAQNGGFLFGGIPATSRPDNKKFQFPRSSNFKDGWWPIERGREACCIAARPHVFESIKGKRPGPGALYTFRIKAAAKADIRQRLEKLFGYKHSTIYPDFSGFSSFAVPHIKSF